MLFINRKPNWKYNVYHKEKDEPINLWKYKDKNKLETTYYTIPVLKKRELNKFTMAYHDTLKYETFTGYYNGTFDESWLALKTDDWINKKQLIKKLKQVIGNDYNRKNEKPRLENIDYYQVEFLFCKPKNVYNGNIFLVTTKRKVIDNVYKLLNDNFYNIRLIDNVASKGIDLKTTRVIDEDNIFKWW